MKEFQASALVGDAVRGLHSFSLTPEVAAERLRPAMTDAVCTGVIHSRLDRAIADNQATIRDAQNRIADLTKLRTLIASRGSVSEPAENPASPASPAPGHTPAGPAADPWFNRGLEGDGATP
jgi:hypothetical protein